MSTFLPVQISVQRAAPSIPCQADVQQRFRRRTFSLSTRSSQRRKMIVTACKIRSGSGHSYICSASSTCPARESSSRPCSLVVDRSQRMRQRASKTVWPTFPIVMRALKLCRSRSHLDSEVDATQLPSRVALLLLHQLATDFYLSRPRVLCEGVL